MADVINSKAMKRLALLVFVGFLLYFLFSIRQVIIDQQLLLREEKETKQKLSSQQVYLAALKMRISGIKNEDRIEELARTRLGLIKKGEVAFKVIN